MSLKPVDDRIVRFIDKHHVLNLATCKNSIPYCANCFYVYLREENMFVFSSDMDTRHAQEAIQNNIVAGSVVLETKKPGLIQGLQIQGRMERINEENKKKARKAYFKRFPYAQVMDVELWTLHVGFFKLTDNRLGFGKKIIWQDESFIKSVT
ncbi:MAG: pyridoxamine 5'-phosphate oxidase family protein [Bacteroidota bacterium]